MHVYLTIPDWFGFPDMVDGICWNQQFQQFHSRLTPENAKMAKN